MKCVTDLESKCGQIMQSTKASGGRTRPMVAESSGMLTETSTKENGKMTRLMDTESTSTSTGPNTRDIGRMTSRTAKAWSHGKTEVATKVATRKE